MVNEHPHHGAGEHGDHVHSHNESSPMLLALSLILASLILSTSVYFSAQMLSNSLMAKSFSVNIPAAAAPVINITLPASALGAAQANAAAVVKPAAAPAAAAGCGVPAAGTGAAAAPTKATVDITGLAVKGPANAKVTLVEFSDFQCPYCVRVQSTIAQLLKDYPTQINVVHENFVVHSGATLAHISTLCAGDQGQYWAMHDQIFSTQKTDNASLRSFAQGFGLDMAKFDACVATGKTAELAAQKAAGSAIGVSGTPSFVIGVRSGTKVNGQLVVGAQDISVFKAAIDAQLKN